MEGLQIVCKAENPIVDNAEFPQDSLETSLVLPYGHKQLNLNKN